MKSAKVLHLADELGESRRGQGADAWRCTHEARELTARAFPAKAVVLICDGGGGVAGGESTGLAWSEAGVLSYAEQAGIALRPGHLLTAPSLSV